MNQAQKCTKCHKIPDDILMLACNHDLCLLCAARSFAFQNKKTKRFLCDVCSSPTELDSTSVYELEKLHLTTTLNERSNKKKSNMSSEKQIRNRSSQKTENKENINQKRTLPTKHLSKQLSENSFVSKSQCSDHPDEDVNYYCFDCHCRCICPECIIHGVHKNHEFKTIKKSYPVIKKQLEDQVDQNLICISQIDNQRQELERRQSQQLNSLENIKQQLQQEFQILHQILVIKEQEIFDQIDNIPNLITQYSSYLDKSAEIENKLNQYNEKINDIIMNKDEAGLLNYFAHTQSQPQPQVPQFPNIKEIVINQSQLQNQMNEIKIRLEQITIEATDDKGQRVQSLTNSERKKIF